MFRIKELETNVIYDDVYATFLEACAQIIKYKEDDSDRKTKVNYIVIDIWWGGITNNNNPG